MLRISPLSVIPAYPSLAKKLKNEERDIPFRKLR
jgi:hypothetical protein